MSANHKTQEEEKKPDPVNEWYWKCCNDVFGFIVERVCTNNHPPNFSSTDKILKEHHGLYIMVRTMDKLWLPNLGSTKCPDGLIALGRYWHEHIDRMNELVELADLLAS